MRRLILLSLASLLFCATALAWPPNNPPLTVEEEDGSPSVIPTLKIKVTNGSLTDNGDQSVSIATGTSTEATFTHLQVDNLGFHSEGDATFAAAYVSGNLGIGTDTPKDDLHIHIGSGNQPAIRLSDSDSTSTADATGYLEVYHGADTTRAGYFGLITSAEMALATTTATGNIGFYTGGGLRRVKIDSSGNFGINDNTPDSMLDINTGDATRVGIQLAGSASQSADALQIDSDGDGTYDDFVIQADGNVGIGTSSPSNDFQVVGSSGSAMYIDADNRDTIIGQDLFIVGTTSGPHLLNNEIRGASSDTLFLQFLGGSTIDSGSMVLYGSGHANAGLVYLSGGRTANSDILLNYAGSSDGNVGVGTAFGTDSVGAKLGVTIDAAAKKGVIVKGAAAQSASLMEWHDNSGNVLGAISSAGDATFTSINSTRIGNSSANDATFTALQSTGNVGIQDSTPSYELDVSGEIRATVGVVGGNATFTDATFTEIRFLPNSSFVDGTFTASAVIENLAAADDNLPLWTPAYPVTITSIGCHSNNASTTLAAQISLEDRAGNAMTHAVHGCTVSGDTTFTAVTAANTLNEGEGLRMDVDNAVDPETDTYEIIWTYTRNES